MEPVIESLPFPPSKIPPAFVKTNVSLSSPPRKVMPTALALNRSLPAPPSIDVPTVLEDRSSLCVLPIRFSNDPFNANVLPLHGEVLPENTVCGLPVLSLKFSLTPS